MNCKTTRQKLFDRLDCEIDDVSFRSENAESDELNEHLKVCVACRQEYRMLSLPRMTAMTAASVPPSSWFYQKLRANIQAMEAEAARSAASLEVVWRLAYRMVPAMAGITLMLISIFAWQQTQLSPTLPHNYDRIFISDDATQVMLTAEQNDITYESVLTALAERQLDSFPDTK